MFDLEQSIEEWRRQLVAAGIKTPALLAELEGHLREDVEKQVRAGMDPQQAFREAAQRMGDARALEAEFTKAGAAFNHDRVYSALLAAMAVYFAAGCVLFFWLARVSASVGPLGLRHTPEWSLPWQAALALVYAVATLSTLVARLVRPEAGQRMSRILNWALVPILPFGTLLGLYGLWKADKAEPQCA